MLKLVTAIAFLMATALGAVTVAAPSGAPKAKFNKQVAVGQQAPDFKALTGIDEKPHSLSDYRDSKIVVVAITCNTCPVAAGYEQRFVDFTQAYADRGVAFIAINPAAGAANQLEKMQERAVKRSFNFDYLSDSTQSVARAYGATVTPQLFVLDENRRIAYMGAFDNSLNPRQVDAHYVRDAVDALLAEQQPELTETRAFGCGIEYQEVD